MRTDLATEIGLFLLAATGAAHPAPAQQAAFSDECLAIAEVARSHYKFEKAVPVPLLPSGTYLPQCPWRELGFEISVSTDQRANRYRWLRFSRPRIHGSKALVRTGIMRGRMAGIGAECELVRERAGWRLTACRRTWVT